MRLKHNLFLSNIFYSNMSKFCKQIATNYTKIFVRNIAEGFFISANWQLYTIPTLISKLTNIMIRVLFDCNEWQFDFTHLALIYSINKYSFVLYKLLKTQYIIEHYLKKAGHN